MSSAKDGVGCCEWMRIRTVLAYVLFPMSSGEWSYQFHGSNRNRWRSPKRTDIFLMIPLLTLKKNASLWQKKRNLKSGGMFMAVFMDHLIQIIQRPDLKQTKQTNLETYRFRISMKILLERRQCQLTTFKIYHAYDQHWSTMAKYVWDSLGLTQRGWHWLNERFTPLRKSSLWRAAASIHRRRRPKRLPPDAASD